LSVVRSTVSGDSGAVSGTPGGRGTREVSNPMAIGFSMHLPVRKMRRDLGAG
jgi:hypothetical protein